MRVQRLGRLAVALSRSSMNTNELGSKTLSPRPPTRLGTRVSFTKRSSETTLKQLVRVCSGTVCLLVRVAGPHAAIVALIL